MIITIHSEDKEISSNQEINENSKIFSSAFSIGVFSGLHLGTGKIVSSKKFTKEKIWFVQIAGILPKYLSDHLFIIGLYYQTNYFKDPERKGFFLKTDFGIDYINMPSPPLDPGGSNPGKDDWRFIFPNLAFGCGYNFLIGTNNSFRISIDAGIKVLICNLNLEYCF